MIAENLEKAYENGEDREARRNMMIASTIGGMAVSYTHLRAHETKADLVCRLLLEKKKKEVQRIGEGGRTQPVNAKRDSDDEVRYSRV